MDLEVEFESAFTNAVLLRLYTSDDQSELLKSVFIPSPNGTKKTYQFPEFLPPPYTSVLNVTQVNATTNATIPGKTEMFAVKGSAADLFYTRQLFSPGAYGWVQIGINYQCGLISPEDASPAVNFSVTAKNKGNGTLECLLSSNAYKKSPPPCGTQYIMNITSSRQGLLPGPNSSVVLTTLPFIENYYLPKLPKGLLPRFIPHFHRPVLQEPLLLLQLQSS